MPSDRSVLFIDGNNWYHSLRDAGVSELGRLDYKRISEKIVQGRPWIGTRYYIGRVRQRGDVALYAAQRKFLDSLRRADSRISVHLGRLEQRFIKSATAIELKRYLHRLPTRIEPRIFQDLMRIAERHEHMEVTVEKAVDVMIAVEMVVMAERDEYDRAYLLSADGDFTPAVGAIRARGKRVYAVSPGTGAQLAAAVNSFIRLDAAWFEGCHLSP